MKKLLILINILLLISCNISFFKKNKQIQTKYREKNPIEVLKIESSIGDIDIIGWSNNIIEIEANKTINSVFKNDISLLNTIFTKNEKELSITAKIPERVKGKINFKIFVPYMLLKIYIDSQIGNIDINKYLGDIEVKQNKGNININFFGNILRLDSEKSKILLNINSFNSTDIIVINKNGNTKITTNEIGDFSFIDIKSLNGDIELLTSDHISYKFSAINQNRININFNYTELLSSYDKYNYISGIINQNKNNCMFDISNLNGKINLKNFKKTKNDLILK